MSECLDDETLTAHVEGVLGTARRRDLEEHIDHCAACRSLVADLARAETPDRPGSDPPRTSRVLHPGDEIGRYQLLEVVGLGNMGVVWAARDPDLGRTVALKLLSRDDDTDARTRLLREARVLAKLRHPNVLVIHDVGEHDGRVFLATEMIEGMNLRGWLKRRRLASAEAHWREALDVFVAAGRGLAAAHAAQIVHRDFKPENLLVELDPDRSVRRVLVTDFGLARAMDGPATAPERTDAAAVGTTQDGAVIGTPAYMAPEVLAGEAADDKADQFSFCAALWEALHGTRPHAGRDLDALYRSALDGPPRVPGTSTCPAALTEALRRGLAPEPADRFASMEALLDALRTAATPSPRRVWRFVVAGTVATGAVGVGAWWIAARDDPCDGVPEPAWTAERRARAAQAFGATGRSYAKESWARVDQRLVEYEADWRDVFESTCHGPRSHAELECLHRRFASFETLCSLLEDADAPVVLQSTSLLAALQPPDRCRGASIAAAHRPWPDDDEARADVAAVRRSLERVRVFESAGEHARASRDIEGVIRHAKRTGFEPVLAETLALKAEIAREAGRLEDAISLGRRVLAMAESTGHDLLKIDAAIGLFQPLGELGRLDEAQGLADLAEATLRRLGGDDDYAARLVYFRGELAQRAGHPEQALTHQERALELWISAGSPNVGFGHHGLATALRLGGRLTEALKHQQAAVAGLTEVRGPSHPATAQARASLGLLLSEMERHHEALEELALAVGLLEDAFGPDSPNLGQAVAAYAAALDVADRPNDALVQFERCDSLLHDVPPDHAVRSTCARRMTELRAAAGDP